MVNTRRICAVGASRQFKVQEFNFHRSAVPFSSYCVSSIHNVARLAVLYIITKLNSFADERKVHMVKRARSVGARGRKARVSPQRPSSTREQRYTPVCDPKASVFKGIPFSSRLISGARVLVPRPLSLSDFTWPFFAQTLFIQKKKIRDTKHLRL